MSREIEGIVRSNLSQFRSQSLTRQQGNPATATQINYEASEQAKMGKTQLSRIYEQYDWLYAEKYRRATNSSLTKAVRGGKAALDFIDRCERRGVPRAWLDATQSVRATRVVGQGSSFMRAQALEFLLGMVQMLPETGRANLIKQVIASRAGQCKVAEFYPEASTDTSMAEQQAGAMLQVASMKTGVPAVPAPTQNPFIYASVFVQAAEGAAQSISQGTDPHEPLAFTDLAIPATETHLQRMAGDKTRAPAVKQLEDRLEQVRSFTTRVKAQLTAQAGDQRQAASQMARLQQGTDPETQVGLAKVQAKSRVDLFKAQTGAQLKAQKQQFDQSLALRNQQVDETLRAREHIVDTSLADAETARKIARDDALARAKAAAPKPASNGKGK